MKWHAVGLLGVRRRAPTIKAQEVAHLPRLVNGPVISPAQGIKPLLIELEGDDRAGAAWIMNADTGIAERSQARLEPPRQPEACGRCHSRRTSGYARRAASSAWQ